MTSPEDSSFDDEEAPRRSRGDAKRERVATETALAELSERLLSANAKTLAVLQLDDGVLQAIEDAKRIASAPARARALRRVRSMLRGADWLMVLRRLDALAGGIAPSTLRDSEAGRQAALLSAQGDPALSRFIEQFPRADRSRLRQLMQNARRAPVAKREKARRQLESVVQATLDEHQVDAEAAEPSGT